MKYFHWFKGLVFIALACSFTAQGSTVEPAGSKDKPHNVTSSVYKVAVSSGQDQSAQASANVTISGENSKVSVSVEGTVTVVAGKSIVFGPGTKVSHGGFLYASIGSKVKSGKHKTEEIRLVTVEENNLIEVQAGLSFAATLFSPFPTRHKGLLHAGDAENGSFTISGYELSGVSPEQQRKVAVESRILPEASRQQMQSNFTPLAVSYAYRPETLRVLRL